MSIIENLISLLSKQDNSDKSEETLAKQVVISFVSILSAALLAALTVFSFIQEDFIFGNVLASGTLLFIINLLLLKKYPGVRIGAIIYTIIAGLVLLTNLVFNDAGNYTMLFMLTFPIIALLCFDSRTGTFVSLGFLILAMVIIILFRDFSFFKAEYDTNLILLTAGAFIFIHFGLFVFESLYSKKVTSVQSKLDDINQESRSKDEFISKLSHQIRTPLNNIMVISNLLNESELDTKTKDLFDTIIASTNNLVNVVNNIVKASNVEINDIKKSKISFNVYATIDSTIRLFINQGENKISINFSSPEDFKKNNLMGDPIKIKQIFLNIIENIIKSENSNGIVIDINLNKLHDENGKTELAFEIITSKQVDLQHAQVKDMGDEGGFQELSFLDINISRRIIEASGGKLNIENRNGQTFFRFNLSFNKAPKDKPVDRVSELDPSRGKPSKRVKIEDANVLLVEDNLINQKIVVLSLNKVVSNIDIANNGKEALDKFGSSRYDIILMDIQMPVMDGIVATKKIREIEASTNSHTPIIAITANALSGDRENCIAAGMNDYISKPFQVEDLMLKMRNLLMDGTD